MSDVTGFMQAVEQAADRHREMQERIRELEERVVTIADESSGPHPVLTAEEALTLIEGTLAKQRARIREFEAEIERLKSPEGSLPVAEKWLRKAGVQEARFITGYFGPDDNRAALSTRDSLPCGDTLAEAYAALRREPT